VLRSWRSLISGIVAKANEHRCERGAGQARVRRGEDYGKFICRTAQPAAKFEGLQSDPAPAGAAAKGALMPNFDRYAPIALAVLRIVVALLFIEHGTQKLFGFPPMPDFGGGGPPGGGGLPPIMLVAGILETFGGLAILVGFMTRPVAFVLAGEMAVAYWIGHFPRGGFFPVNNFGEAAVLFCFVFLYLVFAGPGAFSIDGRTEGKAETLG
jgi:putative oxidoreductase